MTDHQRTVSLDGSYNEGGRALLHTALALSVLTTQSLRISNIRGLEKKSGLRSEDLGLIQLLSEISGATVVGAELNSPTLEFNPKVTPQGGDFELDLYSHAKEVESVCIPSIAHTLWMVLSKAGKYSKVSLKGELYPSKGINYDVFEWGSSLLHSKQGLYAYPILKRCAYDHSGDGEMFLEIEPSASHPISWQTRGKLQKISAVIRSAEIDSVLIKSAISHIQRLFQSSKRDIEIETLESVSRNRGLSLLLSAEFESGLGVSSYSINRQVDIDSLVNKTYHSFMNWFEGTATLDAALSTQAIIPAVFADGSSEFITSMITHELQTVVWVVKQFIPARITISGKLNSPGKVVIK